MIYLKQTLTLSTVGASLITSNSFWFFEFFGLQPFPKDLMSKQITEPTPNPLPEIQTPPRKTKENMNRFKTALKHENITGKPLKNTKLKTGTVLPDMGFDFTLDDLPENKYMAKITSQTMDDFTLTFFEATEEEYKNFSKDQIKINLFTNPAWYSQTEKDEYSKELSRNEINELFKDQDEAKVKQLLLSLHKKLDWKKYGYNDTDKRTLFNENLVYPTSLDVLKDLKIKYFKDFADLKEYVHTKVTTCKGEKIACIANPKELNFMDTDQPSFLKGLEKSKRR